MEPSSKENRIVNLLLQALTMLANQNIALEHDLLSFYGSSISRSSLHRR